MSMEIIVWCREISDAFIPEWLSGLEQKNTVSEIHPEFSFKDQTGFLPFKIKFKNPAHESWQDKYFLTGFEFYKEDFDYQTTYELINPPVRGLSKILGKKPTQNPVLSIEADKKLQACRTQLIFRWGVSDTFELRMATLSAAILSELSDGVFYVPYDGSVYENSNLASKMEIEAFEHEKHLKPREFRMQEFSEWL